MTSTEPHVAIAGLCYEGDKKLSLTEAGDGEVNCG